MTMSVGERARQIRISKGIKQKFVAQAIGYKTAHSYSSIESGQRRLDANKIPLLAEALNVEVEELFFDHEDRNSRCKQKQTS